MERTTSKPSASQAFVHTSHGYGEILGEKPLRPPRAPFPSSAIDRQLAKEALRQSLHNAGGHSATQPDTSAVRPRRRVGIRLVTVPLIAVLVVALGFTVALQLRPGALQQIGEMFSAYTASAGRWLSAVGGTDALPAEPVANNHDRYQRAQILLDNLSTLVPEIRQDPHFLALSEELKSAGRKTSH